MAVIKKTITGVEEDVEKSCTAVGHVSQPVQALQKLKTWN